VITLSPSKNATKVIFIWTCSIIVFAHTKIGNLPASSLNIYLRGILTSLFYLNFLENCLDIYYSVCLVEGD
jgi:hypothetical protein